MTVVPKKAPIRSVPVLFCCCGLLTAGGARADTTNLPAVADTFIVSSAADNNAGANPWFDAGTDGLGGARRGLLRFDLSMVPAGATITSVVLQLTIIKTPSGGAADSTVDLLRLNAAWGEGNKVGSSGAPATTGEATWNAREQRVANWTAPGGASDAATALSASAAITAGVGPAVSWSGPGLVSDAQFWQANPTQNFGWLLRSENEATLHSVRGFASRENSTGVPNLQVGYTLGPGPILLSSPQFSPPATFEFTFTATPGMNYVIRRSSSLPLFQPIATNLATGSPMLFRDDNATGPFNAYSVMLLPSP